MGCDGCRPVLFEAFLNGATYPIPAGSAQIVVVGMQRTFVSRPNPVILPDQNSLLQWLASVLGEASSQGFPVMGGFAPLGGYLAVPRIDGQCVTRLTPVLTVG